MRIIFAGALFILAGCASLSDDLKAAGSKCPQTATVTTFVTCLNDSEEAVFQKDAAENLPDYRAFAAARLSLAQNLDGGKITSAQFADETAKAGAQFAALLVQKARARQQEAAARRAEQDVQDMQGVKPTASTGDMGMGGMGGGMGGMGM
jgi:hypothetical protein